MLSNRYSGALRRGEFRARFRCRAFRFDGRCHHVFSGFDYRTKPGCWSALGWFALPLHRIRALTFRRASVRAGHRTPAASTIGHSRATMRPRRCHTAAHAAHSSRGRGGWNDTGRPRGLGTDPPLQVTDPFESGTALHPFRPVSQHPPGAGLSHSGERLN